MFDSFTFDPRMALVDLARIAIAFILAIPIAWERGMKERTIGLRTFPIVAIASCGYMLVMKHSEGVTAESMGRIIQGLLAGIGFIGGGAIIKNGGEVRGVATAASIWNTGAIGVAVAVEREEIALVLSIVNFAVLRLLTSKKRALLAKED